MNSADIRQAILMAADKIERLPEQFDYMVVRVPRGPDDCGCALGWIGYFAGVIGFTCEVSSQVLHTNERAFYNQMTQLERDGECWKVRASDCAAVLRRYADLCYPADLEQPWLADYLRRLSVAGETGQYVGDVS